MSKANLLQQVDQAFYNQNNQRGLELLREYVASNAKDTEQVYRLAVIEEQIGLDKNAANAYLTCINNDKSFIKAYLYGGYFFQKHGQMQKALALYSLGNDQDARLSLLHQNENLSYETRLRSYTANIALREKFTSLHNVSVENGEGSLKIATAVWPQTHNDAVDYLTAQQQPHLFYIPELAAKPIHDNDSFDWCHFLEASFNDLTSEFSELLTLIKDKGVPYLDSSYQAKGFESLIGSKNWTALNLYKDGVANNSLLSLMPKTTKLLEKLPLYKVDNNPFEVFFSLLKAGQHIAPHFGQSNHSLTVHLPIIVPKGGYLTVAGRKVVWQKGQVIIFDDSFEHEAINLSEEDRVVLIFSIWHPNLSSAEQEDILTSFRARTEWLKNRYQYLACDN
jgi:hypothetical protein